MNAERRALATRSFRRCEDGVAAVEFALVLPLLLSFVLGVTEVVYRIGVRWDVQAYNFQIGDYLSRAEELTDADFQNVYDVRDHVMQTTRSSSTDVSFRIMSIGYDVDDEPVLLWDETKGSTPPPVDLSGAADLAIHGQTVLLAVSRVTTPSFFGTSEITLTRESYFRPRVTRAIALNGSLTEGPDEIEGYY